MEVILEPLGGFNHPYAEAYRNPLPADGLGGNLDDDHRQIVRDALFAVRVRDLAVNPCRSALSPDAIRALAFFLHGSNNVLIPRGLFYDSKLYAAFNSSYDPDSPFANATVYGNDNDGSAHLNARVVQMAVAKNLTLAEAYGILDLAATSNATGNATAFAYPVTESYDTLGLSADVDDLLANDVVANSGNHSVPPPPPTAWELFWNLLAGWAERLWDAVVAVGAFFYNLGKWLVDIAIGLYYGLVEGNWTYFRENVVEPFVEAITAFINWILDLVVALFNSVLDAILSPVKSVIEWLGGIWRQGVGCFLDFLGTGDSSDLAEVSTIWKQMWDGFAPVFLVLTVIDLVFIAIQFALGPVSFLISVAVGLIIGLIADQLMQFLAGPQGILSALFGGDLVSLLSLFGLDVVLIRASGEGDPVAHSELDLSAACFSFFLLWLVLGLGAFHYWSKWTDHLHGNRKLAPSTQVKMRTGLFGVLFGVISSVAAFAAYGSASQGDQVMKQVYGWGSFGFGLAGFFFLELAGGPESKAEKGVSALFKVGRILGILALVTGGAGLYFGEG